MMGTVPLLAVWWVWIGLALIFGLLALMVPKSFFLGCTLAALFMTIVSYVLPTAGTRALLAAFIGLSLLCWALLRLGLRSRSGGARLARRNRKE